MVVLVGKVVAAQLDAELLELLAEGDVVQHIRRQVVGEELLFVIRGAAATRHLNGIAQVPGLPLRVEEDVGVMARDVDELFAVGALLVGLLALVGGDGEDVIARQRDFPVLLDKSRIDVVLNATGIDLGHVLRHPETIRGGHPLDPVLHVTEIATRAQVEFESAFLKTVFHRQIDGATIFRQQIRIAARVPIEVVQRRVAIVVAVAQGETQGFIKWHLIRKSGRREQAHALAIGPVVAGGEVELGTVERLTAHGSVGRHQIAAFLTRVVVAPHLLVVPLQFGFQGPALVELLLQVGDLVQNQGVVL